MIEPRKVVLKYIQEYHSKDLKDLKESDIPVKLNLDYYKFNEYFKKECRRDFFHFNNYKQILNDVELEINKNNSNKKWITIKIVDFPPNILLHELDASYSGEVISSKAMIKNISEIQAGLKTAVYECRGCMRIIKVDVNDNILREPTLCPDCGGRSFKLSQELSEFRNFRYVKLEEPLELRSGGSTREFKAYMQDYLASPYHNLKAGDVVDIIGEFQVRNSDKSNKKRDFEFVIDLHNITPVNNAFEDYRITEEDKKDILKLSNEPNIYERLVKTLAPEIIGYDVVKEGLLLQLFEGHRPQDDVFKNTTMDRWTSHILLIGDPGIGKSQIITALLSKAPKIIDINGADTSQAGLTTSAIKDETSGAWTLEAGAVVLADTGLLCIDEFDKLNKNSQKSLNQPMEQLKVNSAKAGLVQTISARTSILACANPKYSKFNPYKNIKDQIDIPDSTLSRFDLVFALNDVIDEDKDRKIAYSLLNKNELIEKINLVDDELFKKYITYAKLEIFPVLNDDAKKVLIDFYVDTRQVVKTTDSAKPITARDLKSLERLTIARAKSELREEADVDDALCAIRIYSESLKTIGLTPENAGELKSVLSGAEAKILEVAERMINLRMDMYDLNSVDDLLLSDIRHDIQMKCFELGLINAEELLQTALENVRKGRK